MHDRLPNALLDVAGFLDRLVDNQAAPEIACARLASLRQSHPDTSIELVWEDQAFDGSFHYDALIRPPYGGTVSISVCRDSVLPWALRGLQRWRDSELLRVDDAVLSVEDAIAQLDVLWEQGPLMRRLIDSCIVESELQRTAIEVSRQDVQKALDGIRRGRGLLSAAALQVWMQDSGTTLQQLEEMATRLARALALRDRLVGANAESYFRAHQSEFDTLRVAIARFPTEAHGRQVVDELMNSGKTFSDAVQEAFLLDTTNSTQLSLRKEFRYKLNAEFGTTLDSTLNAPQFSGSKDSGVTLIKVLSCQAAEWNESTQHAVQAKLFDAWLSEQRRVAKIEWYWGKANKTKVA